MIPNAMQIHNLQSGAVFMPTPFDPSSKLSTAPIQVELHSERVRSRAQCRALNGQKFLDISSLAFVVARLLC